MYAEQDTCEAVLHIDPMFRKPTQLHNYNLKAKTTQVLYTFVHIDRKPVTCIYTILTEDQRAITRFRKRKPNIRLCGIYNFHSIPFRTQRFFFGPQ